MTLDGTARIVGGGAAEPGPAVNRTVARDGASRTQHERLLDAIIDVFCEHGYEGGSVARIIIGAGVSRRTFYELFDGKEDALIAAGSRIGERVLGDVQRAVDGPPRLVTQSAVGALVAFAREQPGMARVLMNEMLAGGPRVLEARDRTVGEVATLIESVYESVDGASRLPDISPFALVGGVQRLLACRLRQGEGPAAGLEEDLSSWLESYSAPVSAHRWRRLTPGARPSRSPLLAARALRAPAPPGPGRPRMSPAAVAEAQRQRILFAAAEILANGGYGAIRITEITARAGVERRAFYSLFADKSDVIRGIHELSFQRTMAITAGAYFSAGDWPGRVWAAGRALTQFLEQNPVLARASLLESYAGGPSVVERVDELTRAFTIFLRGGYLKGEGPSEVSLEAIAMSVFEIGYRRARSSSIGKVEGLAELLGHLTHICLAPFMGSAEANRQIARVSSVERGG